MLSIMLASILFAEANNVNCFKPLLPTSVLENVDVFLEVSDTITIQNKGIIYALSIDGMIHQPREDSFVRIVLEDSNGHDYLVMESDMYRNDTTFFQLSDYCEETNQLDGIVPLRLKCYVMNATLQISGIHYSSGIPLRGLASHGELEMSKRDQVNDIIDRINAYNNRHNKLWIAGATPISQMSFSDKVKLFGGNAGSNFCNIEYYSGGIFEFSGSDYTNDRDNTPFIDEYDWTYRHGKNWMTSVRNQSSTPYCTAFAVAAGLEAMRNLYFNITDTTHLSVQELACCAEYNSQYLDGKKSIDVDSALVYSRDVGVMPESNYPFDKEALQLCMSDQIQPDDRFKISDYTSTDGMSILSDSIIKRLLIDNGPIVSWIYASMYNMGDSIFNHAMLLVGYGKIEEGMKIKNLHPHLPQSTPVIQAGDPRIGMTYWKFKNSWGNSASNGYVNGLYDGYMYILTDTLSTFHKLYSIQTPILSELLTDEDVVCEDLDGDGLFNWGIGPKPVHCPAWSSDESDGDDSDREKGHMDEYGYCEILSANNPVYQYIYNDTTLVVPESRSCYLGVMRGVTATFQAQQTFEDGMELLLDNGAILVLDGTVISGNSIRPYTGSKIVLNNGAKIFRPFEVPLGVELIINSGAIE